MVNYTKLWLLLKERGLKRTDLREIISNGTLAKLGKNEHVSTETIEKICVFLGCQPGDIMEIVTPADVEKLEKQYNEAMNQMLTILEAQTGMTREQIAEQLEASVPQLMENIKNGDFRFSE